MEVFQHISTLSSAIDWNNTTSTQPTIIILKYLGQKMSPNFYHVMHAFCFFHFACRLCHERRENTFWAWLNRVNSGRSFFFHACRIECDEIWRSIWKYVNLSFNEHAVWKWRTTRWWMNAREKCVRHSLRNDDLSFVLWGPTYANKKSIMKFAKASAYCLCVLRVT